MKKKQALWALLFAIGLFLAASYSIDNRGFHSGIYGVSGCLLVLGSYAGMNWAKLRARDRRTTKVLYTLSGLLGLIIILDLIEALLS